MNFAEYQKFVLHTAKHRDTIYPLLGLTGETGEFMELIKKRYRVHGDKWPDNLTPEETYKFKSELGDILWYIVRIAEIMRFDMEEVASINVQKLTERRLYGKDEAREIAQHV